MRVIPMKLVVYFLEVINIKIDASLTQQIIKAKNIHEIIHKWKYYTIPIPFRESGVTGSSAQDYNMGFTHLYLFNFLFYRNFHRVHFATYRPA
jgi:hypothetical protein